MGNAKMDAPLAAEMEQTIDKSRAALRVMMALLDDGAPGTDPDVRLLSQIADDYMARAQAEIQKGGEQNGKAQGQ